MLIILDKYETQRKEMGLCLILVLFLPALVVDAGRAENNNIEDGKLLIGSFNIQIFGKAKMRKDDVVDVLCKILIRYDLVSILEIRDATQKSFPRLVEQLNRLAGTDRYEFFTGRRVGRSSSKEQTGFIYKTSKLELVDMYERDDPCDMLEREPTIAKFRRITKQGRQREFVLIPIHIKPQDVVAEMNSLITVIEEAENRYGPDIILAGDLNADCSYMRKSCWQETQLRKQSRFKWLIGDEVDTTTKKSNCAYDRIILHGDKLKRNSCCAQVYRFDLDLGLDQKLVEDVSDHYPTELTLM